MGIVCDNPALFDGIIAISLFLAELGLDALAYYFDNPEFSLIAGFIEQLASAYAKDAAYAGIQMMLGEDPALTFLGGFMTQWAQSGNATQPELTNGGGANVVVSMATAIYKLANTTPKSIYFTLEFPEPVNVQGTPSYIYGMGGYTQIPKSANNTPVSLHPVYIPVPLDAQSYENRYGFPPPTNNDLGAFLVSGLAPQFKNYSAQEINAPIWSQRAIDDLFSAYNMWQLFCGRQNQPKQPPPPSGGGGGGSGGGGGLQPPPGGGGGGDELTDCCQLTATYLYAIAQALQNFNPVQATDPACCTNIVNAINGVGTALDAIKAALPTSGAGSAGPVDLTPIVNAIEDVKAALAALPAPQVTVNNTLDCPPDPNVKRIADDLDQLSGPATRANALIRNAVENLGFPADAAQIIAS